MSAEFEIEVKKPSHTIHYVPRIITGEQMDILINTAIINGKGYIILGGKETPLEELDHD